MNWKTCISLTMLMVATPILASTRASAEESVTLLSGLGGNLERNFTGYRLGLQLGGIGATVALIYAGTDASVARHARWADDNWADPAIYAGYIMPPLLCGSLFLAGKLRTDDSMVAASFAAVQASLLTLTYVSTLKFFTGRPYPGELNQLNLDDQSRQFRPGLGRGGIIEGWPSGHTAATAALFSSVAAYYDSPALWVLTGVMTTYIGLGMSTAASGREHWISDTVAGALVGYSMGSSVGEGYRKLAHPDAKGAQSRDRETSFHLGPLLRGEIVGLQLAVVLGTR